MEVQRQRFWARVLLVLLVLGGLGWILHLDLKSKISTDILDLLPAGDRRPEMSLIRSLASEKQGRVVLLALELPAGVSAEAGQDSLQGSTQAFVESLRGSGCFTEVVAMAAPEMREGISRAVYERRLELLFPQWLEQQLALRAAEGGREEACSRWLAGRVAADLEAYLNRGEALALQELLPSDPLLLMAGLMDKLGASGLPLFTGGQTGLVWALQKENPLFAEGQEPVFTAIESARLAALKAHSGVTMRWTGVSRFASESRRRIEAELSWLNLLSLAAVVAVCLLFLSRVLRVWHLVPPIVIGLLGAWVLTTAAFERVHALVFVIGALLGGVAVDYGVYLYLQPPLYPGEPYSGKLARLLKPLLASALTTILGFSLLLASELPLIRQLGVFVGAGLLCALAGAILWFGQLKEFHLAARPLVSRRLPNTPLVRRLALGGALLAVLVALAGPFFLSWRDDIRELDIPAPGLRENDRELRRLFGEWNGRTVYLTHGSTAAAARASWSRFSAWHASTHPEAPLLSLALIVPEEAQWSRLSSRLAELVDFEAELRTALAERNFEPGSFAPFFEAWRDWRAKPLADYEQLTASYFSSLRGPLGLMASVASGNSLYMSIAVHPHDGEPPEGLDTLSTEQLGSLNRTFGSYRRSAMNLSLVGLALLGLSVFLMYGLRRGVRVFAIPLLACFFSFGLLGLLGQSLNLFHLLGAFLGVCLSHNYAIFTTENHLRGEGAPPSIRLSALSTAASFGALAFSRIPVVAALGSSVALIVFTALLIVELEPLLPGAAALPGMGKEASLTPASGLKEMKSSERN